MSESVRYDGYRLSTGQFLADQFGVCSTCAWLTMHLADLSATPPSGSLLLRQWRLIGSTLLNLSRQTTPEPDCHSQCMF